MPLDGAVDLLILDDIMGEMGHQSTMFLKYKLLNDIFNRANISGSLVKIAYHTVHGYLDVSGPLGWGLNFSIAYSNFTSAEDFYEAVSNASDNKKYEWFDSAMFNRTLMDLIEPCDRPYAPNVVLVIWSGESVPFLNILAASAR